MGGDGSEKSSSAIPLLHCFALSHHQQLMEDHWLCIIDEEDGQRCARGIPTQRRVYQKKTIHTHTCTVQPLNHSFLSQSVFLHHYIILCLCHRQLNRRLRSHEPLLVCPSATHIIDYIEPAKVRVGAELTFQRIQRKSEEQLQSNCITPDLPCRLHVTSGAATHSCPTTGCTWMSSAATKVIVEKCGHVTLWLTGHQSPPGGRHSAIQPRVWLYLFTLQDDNLRTH